MCPLCNREVTLTFHHLIPRKVHRRDFYRKNFSKETLNQGVKICRQCHSGIHNRYDEMTLAKNLNTIEAIKSDEDLARHFEWVGKQRRVY